jgi:hypothetical protein
MGQGRPVESPESGYLLVWVTSKHGGLFAVTRGDGSAPALSRKNILGGAKEFALPFRTANCKRGLWIVSDIPCGLICRTMWYNAEE